MSPRHCILTAAIILLPAIPVFGLSAGSAPSRAASGVSAAAPALALSGVSAAAPRDSAGANLRLAVLLPRILGSRGGTLDGRPVDPHRLWRAASAQLAAVARQRSWPIAIVAAEGLNNAYARIEDSSAIPADGPAREQLRRIAVGLKVRYLLGFTVNTRPAAHRPTIPARAKGSVRIDAAILDLATGRIVGGETGDTRRNAAQEARMTGPSRASAPVRGREYGGPLDQAVLDALTRAVEPVAADLAVERGTALDRRGPKPVSTRVPGLLDRKSGGGPISVGSK